MELVVKSDEIRFALRGAADRVGAALSAYLADTAGAPEPLAVAMRYSLEAGGKRLRPALVFWSADACRRPFGAAGVDSDDELPAAMAIECVHTFSLIHDDLPALDDDDLRRGRPSCHKQFGEAMAILAGDALLAMAFEILSVRIREEAVAARLVAELAMATGWRGLIGGETEDILAEGQPPSEALIRRIHAGKTARLIQGACRLGAISVGADSEDFEAVSEYGYHLGLAFQAADDLLDVQGDSGTLGKRTGKDASRGKQTYPRIVGEEGTRRIAEVESAKAVEALALLGDRGTRLAALARFVVERDR